MQEKSLGEIIHTEDDFWDKSNKPKSDIDWGHLDHAIRKECQSCFEWFETTNYFAQRCLSCKRIDAPKRKKIKNTLSNGDPF